MFWIKTHQGNLCNLASATDITIAVQFESETLEVRAWWASQSENQNSPFTILFVGTREECGRKRDDLYRQLLEAQQRWGETDFS